MEVLVKKLSLDQLYTLAVDEGKVSTSVYLGAIMSDGLRQGKQEKVLTIEQFDNLFRKLTRHEG